MSVYVDPIQPWGTKGDWCHMIADTRAELLAMASAIGLDIKRSVQKKNQRGEHIDLRTSKRALAVKHGAVELTVRELAQKMRERDGNARLSAYRGTTEFD